MQPAAMELLHGMQQALGSSTGLVLADTHARNHLHNPTKLLELPYSVAVNASGHSWSRPLSSSLMQEMLAQQMQMPLLGS